MLLYILMYMFEWVWLESTHKILCSIVYLLVYMHIIPRVLTYLLKTIRTFEECSYFCTHAFQRYSAEIFVLKKQVKAFGIRIEECLSRAFSNNLWDFYGEIFFALRCNYSFHVDCYPLQEKEVCSIEKHVIKAYSQKQYGSSGLAREQEVPDKVFDSISLLKFNVSMSNLLLSSSFSLSLMKLKVFLWCTILCWELQLSTTYKSHT